MTALRLGWLLGLGGVLGLDALACAGHEAAVRGPQRPAAPRRAGECLEMDCVLDALTRAEEGSAAPARWQVKVSTNFRVLHSNEAAAARLIEAAERVRSRQLGEWERELPSWSPRCDISLFHNTQALQQMSGREARIGSAEATPSQLMRGRMIRRRIFLAEDDARLVEDTLPHEIAHLILADFLGSRPVPRWATEGLAVLAQSPPSQERYEEILAESMARRQTFPVKRLMEMTRYPDQEYVHLFYAQSLSLTRFLLDRAGRAALLRFLLEGQPARAEEGMRRHLGLNGHLDLQQRWMDFARSRAPSPPSPH